MVKRRNKQRKTAYIIKTDCMKKLAKRYSKNKSKGGSIRREYAKKGGL